MKTHFYQNNIVIREQTRSKISSFMVLKLDFHTLSNEEGKIKGEVFSKTAIN